MIPVLIYFIIKKYQKNDSPLLSILVVALLFCFLGDLLMMIPAEEGFFTLLGICTFMVAQVSFGILFFKSTNFKYFTNVPLKSAWVELAFVVCIGGIFYAVHEYLGDYLIAGILFVLISSTTFLLALNRRFFVSRPSFWLIIAGLFGFLISDVLSALDLFYTNSWVHSLIILNYGIGHILITNGILIQIENASKKEKAPRFGAFSKIKI